ncbi:hypothetical protein BH09PSE6_BH09PSE6_23030 [soil metagenome]
MKSHSLLAARWIGTCLIAAAGITPALAQVVPDAMKGRSLFYTGGYSVSVAGSAVCATCHISPQQNVDNIKNGADEALVRSKMGTGSMSAFIGLRPASVPDATHISAFLANYDSWLSADGKIDFGTVALNTATAEKTVVFGNTSQSTLVISTVTLAGAAAANYTMSTGAGYCTASGQMLTPGQSCKIGVIFKPTVNGARAATVTVKHNVPSDNTLDVVTISGTGGAATTPPVTPVVPATLGWTDTTGTVAMPATATGSTSANTTLTVKNSGTAAVSISKVELTGTNASEFSMTNNCSTTAALAANASCTVVMKFAPLTAGDKTATVSVTDSAAHVLSANVTASATGASTTASPMSNSGGGGAIGAGGAIEWLYAVLLGCATIALARNRATQGSRR